jgi:multidrug efflux system outer membrane protein
MKGKLFLLVGLFAFLTGCTLIPKYTKPEAPVPAAWPSGPAYKETQTAPGAPLANDLKWRDFFAD